MPRPNSEAEQCFVRAQRLAEAGNHVGAQAVYRDALSHDPHFVPALFALGQSLAANADDLAAYPLIAAALELSRGKADALDIIAPALVMVIESLRPSAFDPRLENQVLACLESTQVDPQQLARFIARLLLVKYPDPSADIDAAGRDPLWIAFLTRCLNCLPEMEARLVMMRRRLLDQSAIGVSSSSPPRSAVVLAIQALAGQYVWPVTSEETEALEQPRHPFVAALYRPLVDLVSDADVKRLRKDRLSRVLVQRGFNEVIADRKRAHSIPTVVGDPSANPISEAVRLQYEENPYPCWREAPAPRREPLLRHVAQVPGIDSTALPQGAAQVLVAGCGTGFEAIGLAKTDPDANFLALDLSRPSLAYAARKADELGCTNIRFAQGDILDAAAIGEQFDLIYTTGVLHHMESPPDGLAALVSLLRPGGAIRVAVYSYRARRPIRDAWHLIQRKGWQPIPEDIRAFRAHILSQQRDALSDSFYASADFNSLSGCRDLVFHVQEHQFTVPEARQLLEDAGLRVASIEAPPDVSRQFFQYFGADADLTDFGMWDQLEASDPTIFTSMILIWGQKPL